MARTGVFVCHCGTNIAKVVDCPRVAAEAQKLPGVVFATDYTYMCSGPGQDMIAEAIKEHQLDSVVVASCSPRLHEPTFQRCVEAAGINAYMMEMANIREQVSWVHTDPAEATDKALDLIRSAVAKVQRNQPLTRSELPVTKRAVVIGGGIAGIQAALDIADSASRSFWSRSRPPSRPHVPVRQDLPHARLRRVHPHAQDGRGRQ